MKAIEASTPHNDRNSCGIYCGEPSREPWREIKMARRRGQQKGHVHQQGTVWYVAYREDALDEHGKIVRIRRNASSTKPASAFAARSEPWAASSKGTAVTLPRSRRRHVRHVLRTTASSQALPS